MIIFSKKLNLSQYKEYLLQLLSYKNPKVTIDTDSYLSVSVQKDERNITINLNNQTKGYIIIDVIDPFTIIRIPRTKISDFEKFREFCIKFINNLYSKNM